MVNIKQKRFLVCTLMTALLLTVATASSINARIEDAPSSPTTDENGQISSDTPNLIMTLDGNVTAPDNEDDQPNLYQAQDTPAAVDKNSTQTIAQDDTIKGAEEENLIATQTSPDLTVLFMGIASLFAVAAVVGTFIIVRKRNAEYKQ